MKPGPKPLPPEQKKHKPMTFRLSHSTVSKIEKAVDAKAVKDKTEAIEKAVEEWDFL